jgi:hypothetical protein
MGEKRDSYRILVGKTEGKKSLENPGVNRLFLLKWNFRKWDWCAWTELIWFRKWKGGGLL